jgi:transposase
MRQSRTLSIGLEVHTDSSAVASRAQEHYAAVVSLGTIGTRQGDIEHLIRKLPSTSPPRLFVYEAGPCGAWRYRDLTQKGQVCGVVAPALIPQKPGDRVNTNRREALTLARLRRSGDLPPVDVPTVDEDALRDLGRGRDDARRARKTATSRLNALLLRPDSRYTGRAPWGPAPLRGLSEVVCPTPAPQLVCQAYIRAVTAHTERLNRLAQARTAQGQTWRLAPVVDALQALRGVPCTVAVTTVAARGDLTRGDHPRPLMNSLS